MSDVSMSRGVGALFGGQPPRRQRLSTQRSLGVHTTDGVIHSYPQPYAQVWKFILCVSLLDGHIG